MADDSPVFSSPRERRLWLWTLAVLVAIYSTLGVAGAVADALRERNLLRISLAIAVVVVLGPVLVRWARRRPGLGEIGVALAVVFAYWMVAVRVSSWEERTHLFEYGIVGALIHQALLERVSNGRAVSKPAAAAVALTAVLGLVDELIQAILPDRVFDVADVFFNALAGFMVVAARLAIAPQRLPGWRVWFLLLWAAALGWGQGVYWGWYDDTEPKLLESIPETIPAGFSGFVVGATLIGVLQWLILRRHLADAGRWVLACLGAISVVGIVVFGVGALDTDLGWIIGVSVYGVAAGLLQWLVLRNQIPLSGWWPVASTVGWALGMPFGDLNGPPGLGAVYGVVTASVLVWLLRHRASGTIGSTSSA